MSTLYIPVGIPGCGKSTYSKGLGAEVISTDKIREELTGSESDQTQNNRVFQIAHDRLRRALSNGKDVFFDATNLTRRSRANLLRNVPANVKTVALVFRTPTNTCLERNKKRDRNVPESVIMSMARRIEFPAGNEFDEIINI